MRYSVRVIGLLAMLIQLSACGGGGGGGGSDGGGGGGPPSTVTVGGTVSGLAGTVVLQNNGGDDRTVSTSGAFRFGTAVARNTAYNVTIKTQPANQVCLITAGSGTTAASDITSVVVTCTTNAANTFSVGGDVTGVVGTLILTNAPGSGQSEDLTIAGNGHFTFPTTIAAGGTYTVTVKTPPTNQVCVVANGTGTIGTSAVTDVAVSCTTNTAGTHAVGGTIAGLVGSGLTLQNNGGEDLPISSGAFLFPGLAPGAAYAITIKSQPSYPAQDCTVTNGTGVIGNGDVTNVAITCANLPAAIVQADASVHSAKLSWTAPDSATSFNVYVSSARGCSVSTFASCPDGMRLAGATSPLTVPGLRNAQPYFFQVESVYANGARGLSNEGGARPNAIAFNGSLHAIAPAADGTVYVGGTFREVGITMGSAVPISISSGRMAAADFPIVAGTVAAVVPDGTGGWFLGGQFTSVGNVARKNLARVLANGAIDLHWAPQAVDGDVLALAVSGTTLYVGGRFENVGDPSNLTARHRLAAFDVATADLRLPWNPDANGPVAAIVAAGDAIYVGGSFAKINGADVVRLAALDPTTGAPRAWNPKLDAEVDALALANGTLYTGGQFTHAGVTALAHLAAFNPNDNTATPTTWNPSADGAVTALALSPDGTTVYVSGMFGNVNVGTTPRVRHHFAAFNSMGTGAATDWNPDTDGLLGTALALSADGTVVYASGDFTHVNGTAQLVRHALAAFDATTGVAGLWDPSLNGPASGLVVTGDRVYAGGNFSSAGAGVVRNRLAALDANGVLTAWDPNADDFVGVITLSGDTLYVGGRFTHIGTVGRSCIAAFNTLDSDNGTGALRLSWDPHATANCSLSAIAQVDSTVYVGGKFTGFVDSSQNTTARNDLAALSASVGNAPAGIKDWDPHPDNAVTVLAVFGDTVYVGGGFTQFAPSGSGTPATTIVPRNGLAAIAAFGAADAGQVRLWDPGAEGLVLSLAASADGTTIYVGGAFTGFTHPNAGVPRTTVPRSALAAFSTALSTDTAPTNWDPGADEIEGPATLVVAGSTVYFGGLFGHVGTVLTPTSRNNLAAFNAAGSGEVLTGWDPDPGAATPGSGVNNVDVSKAVSGLAARDNKVYVGGTFGHLGGAARGNFGVVDATTGVAIP